MIKKRIGDYAEFIQGLIEKISFFGYRIVMRREAGAQARIFIRNLIYIFAGLFVAKVLALAFQIYVGRTLGAIEYGKFALVESLMEFFWPLMMMGISTAMVKYMAGERSEMKIKEIVSTGFILMSLFSIIFALFFFAFATHIASFAEVSPKYVYAAIIYALGYSAFVAGTKIYQGLGNMKAISALNIARSLFAAIFILIAFAFNVGAGVAIVVLTLAYALSSLGAFPAMKKYFSFKIEKGWIKTLVAYGSITILATLATVITGEINKILLNIFLTLKEVGLFQAYRFASLGITNFYILGIITVFFPYSSKQKNKRSLMEDIAKTLKLTPLFFGVVFVSAFIILKLYGSEYPFVFKEMFLFTLASTLIFIYSLYNWLAASIGVKGMRLIFYSVLLIGVVNLIIAYKMIPIYGVSGAIAPIIISYTIGTFYIIFELNKIL